MVLVRSAVLSVELTASEDVLQSLDPSCSVLPSTSAGKTGS